tara:strand:- start:2922 stop:3506 length:585 start_codon:yes stop_codon:yes gene_type:complete
MSDKTPSFPVEVFPIYRPLCVIVPLPLERIIFLASIEKFHREVEIEDWCTRDMEHTRSGNDILVRLDPGEEIHTSLRKLADDVDFDAAAITSGIGRTRDNQYGYMNSEGVYKRRPLDSPSELVSLSGNIARTENGDAFTHIHCCWSDDDNNVHAGHMFESTVHVVAEIHIRVMEHATMTRCPLAELELLGLQFD